MCVSCIGRHNRDYHGREGVGTARGKEDGGDNDSGATRNDVSSDVSSDHWAASLPSLPSSHFFLTSAFALKLREQIFTRFRLTNLRRVRMRHHFTTPPLACVHHFASVHTCS